MKRILYLLVPLCMIAGSCTMVIKGLGKSVARRFDDHKDLNVSNLDLLNKDGKHQNFGALYAGKVVYMYVWKKTLPPDDGEAKYAGLKSRFAKYPDVVFINVYTGSSEKEWQRALDLKNEGVTAYRLPAAPENETLSKLTDSTTNPHIIGKDGSMLGYRGPKPSDQLVVDYALDQARNGTDAATSTKKLIKGINSKVRFKNEELETWYEHHFGQKPDNKLNISISSETGNGF